MKRRSEFCLVVPCSVPGRDHIITGSKKAKCSLCWQDVWVSPASLIRIQELELKLLCFDCVPPGPIEIENLTTGQIREIKKHAKEKR